MSITTTWGRRPSPSSRASRSSASWPPPASATTSRSGSPSRKEKRPRLTTSWSSTTSTRMRSSSSAGMSCFRLSRRSLDADHGPLAGRARDLEVGVDLPRPAPHRLEPEPPGVTDRCVEPAPVVGDHHDHATVARVETDERGGRARVLRNVCERLTSDREQLSLGLDRQRQRLVRPLDLYLERRSGGQRRHGAREGGDEAVAHLVRAPLEDEPAHLALRAPRQLRDRAQALPQLRVSRVLFAVELPLGDSRVQHAREQRLRDGVVQVARDAAPVLERTVALAAPGRDQLGARALAVADGGAEEERGQGADEDVQLRVKRAVVDRLAEED